LNNQLRAARRHAHTAPGGSQGEGAKGEAEWHEEKRAYVPLSRYTWNYYSSYLKYFTNIINLITKIVLALI